MWMWYRRGRNRYETGSRVQRRGRKEASMDTVALVVPEILPLVISVKHPLGVIQKIDCSITGS